MTKPAPGWLSVPCPTCGAKVGAGCRRKVAIALGWNPDPFCPPHAARKRAAKEKESNRG